MASSDVAEDPRQIKQPATLIFRDCIVGSNQIQCFLVPQKIGWYRASFVTFRIFVIQTFEEKADLDIKRIGDIPKP